MIENEVTIMPADIAMVLPAMDERIAGNENKFSMIDVRSGLCGLSLYNYAYADLYDSVSHSNKANQLLSQCFERIDAGYISHILYRELAEVGMAIELYKRTGHYEDDTNEVLNDFDDVLYKIMKDDLATQNFDPATGALGYGFYFLERLPSKPAVSSIIQEMATALCDLSFKDERGRYWKSTLTEDHPVYLGISHGTAAIMVFLTKAIRAGVPLDCLQLIREASDYVVSHARSNHPTFFPVIVGEPEYHLHANNWCYGDPGTLYGLLQAALILEDDKLKDFVLDKFETVARRKNSETYLVAGYGLLYGNAGLASMYRRCHEQTGSAFFETAYQEQLQVILDNYNSCDEFLGLKGYWNQEIEVTNFSFSEGLIGIALTLMAEKDRKIAQYFDPFFYL